MTQERVVIVNGARTPFVRARTVFQKMPASILGAIPLRDIVARTGIDPTLIDEVCLGVVSSPSEGTNVAREALFDSGLPSSIPCTTINRYCASAAEAVASLSGKILSGQINIGIAGGVESISSVRALFSQQATDFFQDLVRSKNPSEKFYKALEFSPGYLMPHPPGIKEPTIGITMGQSADLMARTFKISREEQDQFAVQSHKKSNDAWDRGFYNTHVSPVGTPDGKVIDRDTDIRPDTSPDKLATLRPIFYPDGTVTAGNSSPLTDGASAVLLMTESKARELGFSPLGSIRAYATAGVDLQKEPLLIGPAYALPKALKQAGIKFEDIDVIEMHEAFAAQVLSTVQAIESPEFARDKLGLNAPIGHVDFAKLNVNGGSIALGHPFGATGTRLILQALHELKARNKKFGLVSICAAGGLGVVMILEAA